jgi:glycosyltransferase involved in cell wall biosynthesis
MRIAIDYTPAHEQGAGIGRYVRELVAALSTLDQNTDYRLFVAGSRQGDLPLSPGHNFRREPTRISPKWFARFWHRLQLHLPVEWWTGDVDLFHATDFVLPPHRKKTKTLLTVHDLSFVKVPETASPRLKSYLDVVVPRSVKRAGHILADSHATKDDLIEIYGTPAEMITVLHSGVDPKFKPDKSRLSTLYTKYHIPDRPYIFTVGTVQPRKNYGRLIRALSVLRQRGIDVDLVIAGGKGWLEGPMYQALEETDMGNHVHLIGFVDDDDLPTLYSGAACVAFPSLYEGFGFPVLEGMACGVPVMTSNVSSLPEVAGDAAMMIDPYNLDAMIEMLQSLLTDESRRKVLIERGYRQARHFTWERSATQLLQIYQQMLE